MSDGERAAGGDKWWHLREVLAERTKAPLVVDQGGATVVGSVRLGIARAADRAQADRDLSAISACWNCADELLADLSAGGSVEGESVACENCWETVALAHAVPSPYEADDGGSYCPACAARGWAGDIEQREALLSDLARERARAATLQRAIARHIDSGHDQAGALRDALAADRPSEGSAPARHGGNGEEPMALTKSPTSEYVERFAALMEAQLERNRHKGDRPGWLKDAPGDLYRRLQEEAMELCRAIHTQGTPPDEIAREAADVANFCLFIADRCGGLVAADAPGDAGEGASECRG